MQTEYDNAKSSMQDFSTGQTETAQTKEEEEKLFGGGGPDGEMRNGFNNLMGNLASFIAALSVFVLICSFWLEISLEDLLSVNFAMDSALTALLYCVMQFSMQENGKARGQRDGAYRQVRESYITARDGLIASGMEKIEEFCIWYSENELRAARAALLLRAGISYREWESEYRGLSARQLGELSAKQAECGGRSLSGFEKRTVLRVNKMKPYRLCPSMLTNEGHASARRGMPITRPDQKLARLSVFQAGATVLTGCFTASILIEAVSAPTVATFVYCLIKLFCLIWRGAKGYRAGYLNYSVDAVNYHNSQLVIIRRYHSYLGDCPNEK